MNVLSRLKQVATISTVAVCISVAPISQATAAERYIVSGVESWDTLNIRSQPSARSAIIGEIPADGQNINSSGETRGNGRTTWIRVTYNGVSGWVSKRYLATDYTFNGATVNTAATSATNYTPQPVDTSATTTVRTGSIYDAGSSTVARSVYVGPGNGLPAITTKRQTQFFQPVTPVAVTQPVAVARTGNTHSHPANRCTRSIAHNHAGPAGHSHRYSCQGQATQQQPQRQTVAVTQVVVDNNSHTHPRNQYSNAITHSHASNNRQHSHNYGRQVQQQRVQVRAVATGNSHTHPRNQFSNAVTHNHASNDVNHRHNYGRQVQQQRVQVRAVATGNSHTHPLNQYSNAVTHNHASNNPSHSHNYGRQVQQQRVQVRAVATGNSHTHPRNQFSNAITHNHASNDVNHRHNYGQNRVAQQTQQVAVRPAGSNQVTHIHPQSPYNARTTHTHPGGAGIHIHDFLLPPAQRSGATQQMVQNRDVNAHTHPKNQFTNSVTHTHANGVNNHSHSYGAR